MAVRKKKKKAAGSRRPSKTVKTSSDEKPGQAEGAVAEVFSVGFSPRSSKSSMGAADQKLFQAFQANLLSLISHELRTPLTGILNALTLLDDVDTASEFSATELIAMARRNAQRLNDSLAMLLDLAALESGTFAPRLREVSIANIVRARAKSYSRLVQDQGLEVGFHSRDDRKEKSATGSPVLADPQKLGRAIDLCFQLIASRAAPKTAVEIQCTTRQIQISFELNPSNLSEFERAWVQALAGYESGATSSISAFTETLQTEEKFLTRTEEGLGSEFLLIHEIMRIHQGVFSKHDTGKKVILVLELPELGSLEALKTVLGSRVYLSSTGLGTVALGLIQIPENTALEPFRNKMKTCLFRATDALYTLPDRNQLALVMDDCKKEDAPRLMSRLERTLGQPLAVGVVTCPEEAADPEILIEMAQKRLEQRLE